MIHDSWWQVLTLLQNWAGRNNNFLYSAQGRTVSLGGWRQLPPLKSQTRSHLHFSHSSHYKPQWNLTIMLGTYMVHMISVLLPICLTFWVLTRDRWGNTSLVRMCVCCWACVYKREIYGMCVCASRATTNRLFSLLMNLSIMF